MINFKTYSYGYTFVVPWWVLVLVVLAIAAGVIVLWMVLRRAARNR
jgi:hypothetical protein